MSGTTRVLVIFRVLAVLLVTLVAIRVAWVSDDALITLRTALNITHGWGPGFNATEAVQAYTHPLWFLLWVAVGTATNQWILGILALGVALVAIATSLLVVQVRSVARLVIVVGLLLLSNSFIDYTSSGLENPLAYAGVAVLITLSIRPAEGVTVTRGWAVAVGLSTAAVFLTRIDLLALIAVPMAILAWQHRRGARTLAIGALAFAAPLIVWFTWTFLTYASLLPNTFAAKTNAQVPRGELIVQGLRYLWVSFENDPVTLIGVAAGIAIGLGFGPRILRGWAIGTLTYLLYIVWIGGDFMGGRFLAVPLFVSVFVIAASPIRIPESVDDDRPLAPLGAAVVTVAVLLGAVYASGIQSTALANPQIPRWQVDQNFNAGVVDARGASVADGDSLKGLVDSLSLAFTEPDIVPIGDGTGLGRSLRALDKSAANWPTNDGFFTNPSEVGVFCGYLGNIGIATGPITHLIDSCALTDRFLAERPFVSPGPFAWKPGHFHRSIPEGYEEAVATGDPSRMTDAADAFALTNLWERIR